MYTTEQLGADASGYGTVLAVLQDHTLLQAKVPGLTHALDPRDAACYLDHRYCEVRSNLVPHLYRVWDSHQPRNWKDRPPGSGAFMLGNLDSRQRGLWVSPLRPAEMVDYRQFAALKNEWNRADFVLDATLNPGARVFVGRAGPQTEIRTGRTTRLSGGAMQFFIPKDQFGFLWINTWWAIQ